MSKVKSASRSAYNEIYETTVENLKTLGTYKPEFTALICRYAETRLQFDLIMKQWYDSGCAVAEEYTNKGGAVNYRKTALYQAIETLRRELLDVENVLGLTPVGIHRVNNKALAGKKSASAIEKFFTNASDG
jgi:hypothetical protein